MVWLFQIYECLLSSRYVYVSFDHTLNFRVVPTKLCTRFRGCIGKIKDRSRDGSGPITLFLGYTVVSNHSNYMMTLSDGQDLRTRTLYNTCLSRGTVVTTIWAAGLERKPSIQRRFAAILSDRDRHS